MTDRTKPSPSAGRARSPRRLRLGQLRFRPLSGFGRLGLAIIAVLTFSAVLVVGVLPTTALWDRRGALEVEEARLAVLGAKNDTLEDQIELLQSAEHIELRARAEFGYVWPGQEAYPILPAPAVLVLPPAWPFTHFDRTVEVVTPD